MEIDAKDLRRGTELFIEHLEHMQEEDPELSDFHAAFEAYSRDRYSLGTSATTRRTGGGHDLGIDFFSAADSTYHVGQCKTPAADWLAAHSTRIKKFGPATIQDPRDALRYLFGESDVQPNDQVKYLRALVEGDRGSSEFRLVFFLVVYGTLNPRAKDSLRELREQYEGQNVEIVLQEIDSLVDTFIIGAHTSKRDIRLKLRIGDKSILRARDYCYFLVNASDIFEAFRDYGWRLFDLNLRYEVKNSPINGDIVRSLKHQKSRRQFHHYNNGLIIVARSYKIPGDESSITLQVPQIVNGLQTVKSIYNAISNGEVKLEELDKECCIQAKVIKSENADLISQIVQATNNQNTMAPRNLKANTREQKELRTSFASLTPRWFLQVKQDEWVSLTQEGAHFFKPVVGYKPSEFKSNPSTKKGRVADNQEVAKAWLAFIGYSDLAGDRVTHYFSEPSVYRKCFLQRPATTHWEKFASQSDFDTDRDQTLEDAQGGAGQYLLAFYLFNFAKRFIPSTQVMRSESLERGARAGKLKKSDGSIVSPTSNQEEWLAGDSEYQTWRLLSNMKELVVECASQILAKRYGALDEQKAWALLSQFEAASFVETADTRELAIHAASATDFRDEEVFSRIFAFLRFVGGQFFQERKSVLLSTSRLRTVLLKRSIAKDLKDLMSEHENRALLDKPWKKEGVTFIESLPDLSI